MYGAPFRYPSRGSRARPVVVPGASDRCGSVTEPASTEALAARKAGFAVLPGARAQPSSRGPTLASMAVGPPLDGRSLGSSRARRGAGRRPPPCCRRAVKPGSGRRGATPRPSRPGRRRRPPGSRRAAPVPGREATTWLRWPGVGRARRREAGREQREDPVAERRERGRGRAAGVASTRSRSDSVSARRRRRGPGARAERPRGSRPRRAGASGRRRPSRPPSRRRRKARERRGREDRERGAGRAERGLAGGGAT